MTTDSEFTVYVGNYGTYQVPADVLQRAIEASGRKALKDRRTKGARMIARWGRDQDATEEAAMMIARRINAGFYENTA